MGHSHPFVLRPGAAAARCQLPAEGRCRIARSPIAGAALGETSGHIRRDHVGVHSHRAEDLLHRVRVVPVGGQGAACGVAPEGVEGSLKTATRQTPLAERATCLPV